MEATMPNYHVTVHGTDRDSMADLVRRHGTRVYAQTLQERPGTCQVDAIADEDMINTLRAAGYTVDRHEDVDEAAQESLGDVGTGNRYRQATGE
jgi:hypothetical protein